MRMDGEPFRMRAGRRRRLCGTGWVRDGTRPRPLELEEGWVRRPWLACPCRRHALHGRRVLAGRTVRRLTCDASTVPREGRTMGACVGGGDPMRLRRDGRRCGHV